jgi:outer membrane immunogenic protein
MRNLLFPGAAAFGLALAGAASTAHAADLGGSVYTPAPAYAPTPVAPTWSGIYAGVDIGWAGYANNVDVDPQYISPTPDYDYGADGNGAQIGLNGGVDWQFGSVVVGGLADVHWSNADGSGAIVPTSSAEVDSNWGLDLLARGGFAPSQNLLVYGVGGYSQESVDIAYASAGGGSHSDTDTLRGWTLGAGVEAMVAPNISVKGEYRYTNFADLDFSTNGSPDYDKVTLDSSRNSVLVGVNYRFNGLGF